MIFIKIKKGYSKVQNYNYRNIISKVLQKES